MKTPKIGDIATIHGEIVRLDGQVIVLKTPGVAGYLDVNIKRVSALTTPPWTPKIGEEVNIDGILSLPDRGYTVLAIHGDGDPFHTGETRRWAVVAFGSDKPEVFNVSRLRQRVKA